MTDTLAELNHEWSTIDRRRDMRRFIATLDGHPLLEVGSAEELEARIRRTDRAQPDVANTMLLELVRMGRREPCAQRVVLQALLPGLCCVARRACRREPHLAHTVSEELVSLAGWKIATYTATDTMTRVAPSVLRSVERDYHRQREKAQREVLCPGSSAWRVAVDEFGDSVADDRDGVGDGVDRIADRLSLVAALSRAVELNVVSRRDLEIFVVTRLAEQEPPELTARFGRPADTIRRARNRAQLRLTAFCDRPERTPWAA